MEQHIVGFVDKFISEIKNTEEYERYYSQVLAIGQFPDLMEQINEYRKENFQIQNQYEGDELYDKLEEFSSKYESFMEDPRVSDFLQSEVEFCRLMQEINVYIMEGIDFR